MADSTWHAPTEVGAAANETEILAVDYPETAGHAWSAEVVTPYRRHWQVPTWVKYLVPAAIVAVLVVVLMGGGHQQVPTPSPVPQTTAPWVPVVVWTPTPTGDSQYTQAMQKAGWIFVNQQADLEDAHWSCTYLTQGHTKEQLVRHWDQVGFKDKTEAQAHKYDEEWVGIVVDNMCPQYN